MDSPKPFASHGKPPSLKYVFGKTNLPGGLKEPPQLGNQTAAERVAAGNAGSADCTGDIHEKIDQLRTIREENKRSKIDEEMMKPKQQALNSARAVTEVNQLEMIEAKRRKEGIVKAQLDLMAQIVSNTEQQLREEMRAKLIQELTPEIKASLKTQFEDQAKQEIYAEVQNSTASLRDALNDSVREDLRNELRPVVLQESEARMKAHEIHLRQSLKEKLEKEIRAELKSDLRHSVELELRQEIRDAWVREDERLLQRSCHIDPQFSEKQTLDQQTKSARQLHSAYRYNAYHEAEIPQIQIKSFYSSSQDQTYDTLKAPVKQHTGSLYKEDLSQLQYDDGHGSSGKASPEKHAQYYHSSAHCFVKKQLGPIAGSSKKRRRSLDDQDYDYYSDNRHHDKKRRRSDTDHPQYVELSQYLPGEVLGMPQPKSTSSSSPPRSIKPPIDTLEREVEDVYGPAPMRPKSYAYSFGTSLTGHFSEQEEGSEDDYASSEEGAGDGKEETDLPKDTSEPAFEDDESKEHFHDQSLRHYLDMGIPPGADIRNTLSRGNSVNDPITLESSDDEDYPTGEEAWEQDRTLVGDLGEVRGKDYLAKEVYEEVEEEDEEEL